MHTSQQSSEVVAAAAVADSDASEVRRCGSDLHEVSLYIACKSHTVSGAQWLSLFSRPICEDEGKSVKIAYLYESQ